MKKNVILKESRNHTDFHVLCVQYIIFFLFLIIPKNPFKKGFSFTFFVLLYNQFGS